MERRCNNKNIMKKEIIYYTCNTHKLGIEIPCRHQLEQSGIPIISVSLNKEINFGDKRAVVEGQRSPEMMHRQILTGLELSDADQVFLCESDVLYHPSHFEFDIAPDAPPAYFYNINVWKYWIEDGLCVWVDDMKQVSGLTANKDLLLEHYIRRNERIEKEGKFSIKWSFEPGARSLPLGFDNYPRVAYHSRVPNVCIRHEDTLTKSKRSPEEFRNKKYAEGFKTAYEIPGWGNLGDIFEP